MEEGLHYEALGDVEKAKRWLLQAMKVDGSEETYRRWLLLGERMKDVFPPGVR